jgi:hypothetical protein
VYWCPQVAYASTQPKYHTFMLMNLGIKVEECSTLLKLPCLDSSYIDKCCSKNAWNSDLPWLPWAMWHYWDIFYCCQSGQGSLGEYIHCRSCSAYLEKKFLWHLTFNFLPFSPLSLSVLSLFSLLSLPFFSFKSLSFVFSESSEIFFFLSLSLFSFRSPPSVILSLYTLLLLFFFLCFLSLSLSLSP